MSMMHVQNSQAMKANEEFCIDGLFGQVVMMYTANGDPKIKVVYMTAEDTMGFSMVDEDYLIAKLKYINEDDLKRTIVEVQIDIDSAVFIFTTLGFGTRILEGSEFWIGSSDLPKTFTDVSFINPSEIPKTLSCACFGYPDLEGTCSYCVLEYSYIDSGKYDSLVVYSKDTKRLSRIGMNDTYSNSITDKNGCKIEYVFTIKRNISGLVFNPSDLIEIKIWARVPVDYINTLAGDDIVCSYLREVYEEHFEIGLQKSVDASISEEI